MKEFIEQYGCGIGQTTHDLSQEQFRSPFALTLHFNLVL